MLHIIIDDLYCIAVERENSSLPEPTGDICWHSRQLCTMLDEKQSGVALVEPMAFLLPVPLEWSKKTDIKGLALVRGVRWKKKKSQPH